MTLKENPVTDALVAAALVATMFCIFMTLADYVLISAFVRLLERWAVLPPGWGTAHQQVKELVAVALAAGPTAIVGWLMYRTARRSLDEE